MKKHCPKCHLDIDDVMGITNCPLCGTELKKGWIGSRTVLVFVGKVNKV